MNINRILAGIGANILDKGVVTTIQLATVPILSISWGVDLYGSWLVIATIPSFLALSEMGLATAAGIRMTMLISLNQRENAIEVYQTAWLCILISCLFLLTLFGVGIWLIPTTWLPKAPEHSPNQVRVVLTILSFYSVICIQGSILLAGFRSCDKYALGMVLSAFNALLEAICFLAIALVSRNLIIATAVMLIARIMGSSIYILKLKIAAPWLKLSLNRARTSIAKDLVRPALAVMALPAAHACVLQGTVAVLGATGATAAIPAFTAARTASRLALQLPLLVNHALLPEYSSAAARQDQPSQAKIVLITIMSSFIMAGPISLLIGVFGSDIVYIWSGRTIIAASELMTLMALTTLLSGIWSPASNLLLAINQQAKYSYSFVIIAALSMPFCYFASQSVGATGAAITAVIVDLLMCIVVYIAGRTYMPNRLAMAAAWQIMRHKLSSFLLKDR